MWENNALLVAFNKVDTIPSTIDFVALKNAGIHGVILRSGTSDDHLNYDDPSANFVHDANYRAWFTAAKAAGLRILIDYDFNAMLDSTKYYNGDWTQRHIDYSISGGFQPSVGGALLLNCERNTWYESVKPIICTTVNYRDDLKAVFNWIWDKFHLVPGIRTGKWFLNKKDESGVQIGSALAFLDKGATQVPFFLARWKKSGYLVTGDFHDVISEIASPDVTMVQNPDFPLDPTKKTTEQSAYLYYGNTTKWSGWEIATVKHNAVKAANGSLATFRLILWNGDKTHFDRYFNFPEVVVPDPEPEPDPEDPPVVDPKYATVEQFESLNKQMQEVINRLNNAKLSI